MHFSCRAALALLLIAGSAVASHAHTTIFTAILTGIPPNASPATGFATVTLDMDMITMRVEATFSGLTGTTTAANIHAPTPGPFLGIAGIVTQTPTFQDFPLGVTSGSYDHTFDLALAASYNPDFLTAHGGDISEALQELHDSLEEGRAYLNIRTSTFSAGEIRGFLADSDSTSAPEPTSFVLMGLGATAFIIRRRRRV